MDLAIIQVCLECVGGALGARYTALGARAWAVSH